MIDSLFRFLLFYIYQINIFHKENVHEIHLKVIEIEQHEKYGKYTTHFDVSIPGIQFSCFYLFNLEMDNNFFV